MIFCKHILACSLRLCIIGPWLLGYTQANAPPAFRLAGRFCVRKRGRVAYRTELTPRRTFGRPYPSQGPVSSNLTASTIKPVGPSPLARKRPPITAPGMSPTRQPFWSIYALAGVSARVARAIPSTRRMSFVNVLSREKQIEVIAALCEGVGIRTASRLTGVNRGTVASLALRVGLGCVELHDRIMVGVRTNRLELDETWSYVGKKQKNTKPHETQKGDQYVFIGMAANQKAIVSYWIGKRDTANMEAFIGDLRGRVIGQPEISTDGFHPYRPAIRDAFGENASHGVIVKTYSVTNLAKDAATRYSPAAVVAVSRDVAAGAPEYISTSYVERQNLSLRMSSRRFTRLTNGFSKKLDNHCAAVALYVAHYNLCRTHEALRTTPAKALGVADKVWTIAQLVDAALAVAPALPKETPPERRRAFTVIQGGKP